VATDVPRASLTLSEDEYKRLKTKIDLFLMPLLMVAYGVS
jgi:hypothetical protein